MSARYEVEICRTQVGLLYGLVRRIEGDKIEVIGRTTQGLGGLSTSRESVIRIATQIARADRNRHESPDIVRLEL